jgi:putative peptidoglycan lipid II flippase
MLVAAAIAGLAAALTVRALQSTVGTAWTGSVVTILLSATAGAGLYALSARGLRIAEFRELTAVMRPGNA